MNDVFLIGRLVKAARNSSFDSGNKCSSFTLVTDRGYKDKDGKYKTYFVPCIAWNHTADVIDKFTTKGTLIAIKGYIQTRSYMNMNSEKLFVTEVVVEQVKLLEKKKDNVVPEEIDTEELFTDDESDCPF